MTLIDSIILIHILIHTNNFLFVFCTTILKGVVCVCVCLCVCVCVCVSVCVCVCVCGGGYQSEFISHSLLRDVRLGKNECEL